MTVKFTCGPERRMLDRAGRKFISMARPEDRLPPALPTHTQIFPSPPLSMSTVTFSKFWEKYFKQTYVAYLYYRNMCIQLINVCFKIFKEWLTQGL